MIAFVVKKFADLVILRNLNCLVDSHWLTVCNVYIVNNYTPHNLFCQFCGKFLILTFCGMAVRR